MILNEELCILLNFHPIHYCFQVVQVFYVFRALRLFLIENPVPIIIIFSLRFATGLYFFSQRNELFIPKLIPSIALPLPHVCTAYSATILHYLLFCLYYNLSYDKIFPHTFIHLTLLLSFLVGLLRSLCS